MASYVGYAVLSVVGVLIILIVTINKNLVVSILVIVATAFVMIGSVFFGRNESQKSLTKGIALTEVPVQGEFNATAIIQITYKDGELDKIVLVPDSTRKIGPAKEEKK